MAATETEQRLRGLLERAERAGAAGQRQEAAQWLAQAQAIAPDHPLVLNSAGLAALSMGDAASAHNLFRQAIEKDSRQAAFWINLATACRHVGAPDQEMKALQAALALEPRHTLALMQLASAFELQGDTKRAVSMYRNALATINRSRPLPESMRPIVQRAVEFVRKDDAELSAHLEQRLADARARHRDADMERFDHCLELLTSKRKLYRCQPTFLYFPHLPAYEYYARKHFPWLEELERATPVIRAELERVLTEDTERLVPYMNRPTGVPLDQWKELNRSKRWSAFFLWNEGARVAENQERCPATTEVLSRLPMAEIGAHAPTVLFSILDARTHIPPHTGVTNARLIVHLPLIVPAGCRFRVGSETREWREGEAWVFDDSVEHEAWNDSDTPRAILIFDVWNPYLTEAERELVRIATEAYGEYYRGPRSHGAS